MAATRKPDSDLPIILFEQPENWARWLEEHHADASGVWVRLAKKASPVESINYAQALEVALCYGWIDSQKRSYDEDTWLQRFTPRKARSKWSKINREKVEALMAQDRLHPAGRREVEAAQADGRWDAAYDSPSNATVPEDLQTALDQNPAAQAFFKTLNSVNRYAILYRIQTAKRADTRQKRIRQFVEMLEKGETVYS